MLKEAIATGSTVDEASEAAKVLLGDEFLDNTDVQFEILTMPQKKTFGLFGGCPAKVRAYIEIPDEEKTEVKIEKKIKKEKADIAVKKSEENTQELLPLTDDIKKSIADNAVEYLKSVFTAMGLDVTFKCGQTESGVKILLEGDNLGVIVGRRGETLDSLQYLTILAANRGHEGYYRVTLDIGNYRDKREKTLKSLAHKMANQSLKTGRNVFLEPMNPYERRIIHTAVQDVKGVSSWSTGVEPNRRVVIGKERGHGSNSSRGYSRRPRGRNSAESVISAEPDREQMKDMDIAPLYGKIK